MCSPRADSGRVPTWTPQWAARWEHHHLGMFTEGKAAAPGQGELLTFPCAACRRLLAQSKTAGLGEQRAVLLQREGVKQKGQSICMHL